MYNLQDLNAASPEELLEIAKTFDIKKADKMAQQDLIFTILAIRTICMSMLKAGLLTMTDTM